MESDKKIYIVKVLIREEYEILATSKEEALRVNLKNYFLATMRGKKLIKKTIIES